MLLVLLVVTGLVMVIYYFTKVNRSATDESHETRFTIEKGLSTSEIAKQLESADIISNKNIFVIYSKIHGAGNKIQAGDYVLNSNMTVAEIVDVLTHGKIVEDLRRLTVIEGLSNKQLAKYLVSRGIIQTEVGLDKALGEQGTDFKFFDEAKKFAYEGFLFPDTYTLTKNNTATDLVGKMLNNFESKVTDKMLEDLKKQNRTFGDALIMASIIEKEVGRNKEKITAGDIAEMNQERKIVASVFLNRLEAGMGLESDATVNYITGKSDRSVTIEDTKINSPYNTYRYKGLPPGPISNPGIDSIMAAIYPANTDYIYFLNSPDGKAYFAKTLAEHGENRAKYLR
ncbi:MAG: endolytic transglycosylase MltG [Candidatus Doudnabacteria bacterium]|nr:endolytic transglycosylase MltG [Candidatus Doudnabacteria bacterium]